MYIHKHIIQTLQCTSSKIKITNNPIKYKEEKSLAFSSQRLMQNFNSS